MAVNVLSVSNKMSSVFRNPLGGRTVFLAFMQGRPIDVVPCMVNV